MTLRIVAHSPLPRLICIHAVVACCAEALLAKLGLKMENDNFSLAAAETGGAVPEVGWE